MKIQNKNIDFLLYTFIFLSSLIIFKRIYYRSDIVLHVKISNIFFQSQDNILSKNFLYYLLIQVFSLGKSTYLPYVSVLILSVFVTLKFIVVKSWLSINLKAKKVSKLYVSIAALCLIFISAIYIPQLFFRKAYICSFTPNLWHNSTTIAVFPFAILLFWQTINQFKYFTWPRFGIILTLVILNAIIKPSYLFVYVGALPFTYLMTQKLTFNNFFKQVTPALIALAIIYIQKRSIFSGDNDVIPASTIVISPFKFYLRWFDVSRVLFIIIFIANIFTSLAYPILVYLKQGLHKQDYLSIFAWISIFGAVLISVLFVETGYRVHHGNFLWQIFPASFILFMVAVMRTFDKLTIFNKRLNIYQIIFGIHILFGMGYILKLLIFKNYF